jgi:prepilin-type N-terminal cleavage/methylation domain-containing protein
MRNLRNSKGFTLIELMIVVVIIGILAAIAIPKFGQASNRAKEKEADGILKQVYTLQSAYQAQHGVVAGDTAALRTVGFEAPTGLQNYVFNAAVNAPTYCLTANAGGHASRCVVLATGAIANQAAPATTP